jgi:hypothetical protein
MSIEKSELKAAFAHALGCDSDDDLEAARRDAVRATGRIQAARMMESEVTKIISKLDGDMESDAPPFRQMEDYAKAKHYLGMCLAQAATLAKASDNLRLQMEGKVMAFQHTITRLSKIKEAEDRKATAIKDESSQLDEALESDRRARPIGAHPGPPIGAQRKAEAVGKKKKKTGKRKRKCGNCGEPGHTARTCEKAKKG